MVKCTSQVFEVRYGRWLSTGQSVRWSDYVENRLIWSVYPHGLMSTNVQCSADSETVSVGSAVSLQYSGAVMIWWLYIPARPGEKNSVLTTYLSCQCLFMINATKPKIMRRRSAWWVQGAMKWCLCKQGKQHFSFDLLVNWKIQQTWSVLVASRGISVSCV